MAAMTDGDAAEVKTLTEYDKAVSSSSKACVFFWAAWHEPSKPGGQMDEVRCPVPTLLLSLQLPGNQAAGAPVLCIVTQRSRGALL